MKRITTSHISLQDLSKSTSEKGEKSSSNFFYPKKNWVARNIKTLFGAYSDKNRDCSIAITTKIPTLRGDILLNILITFEKQKPFATIIIKHQPIMTNFRRQFYYTIQYTIFICHIRHLHMEKKNEENWWQKINGEKTWKKPRGL